MAALSHCRITRVAGGWRHTVAADSEGRLYAWGWNKVGRGSGAAGGGKGSGSSNACNMLCAKPATHAACPLHICICICAPGPVSLSHITLKRACKLYFDHLYTSSATPCPSAHYPSYPPPPAQFGQLGLGDTEDRCLPTPVAALAAAGERVALLACGWRHTLAVADSGAVYSWGRGVNGQLGHGVEQDL